MQISLIGVSSVHMHQMSENVEKTDDMCKEEQLLTSHLIFFLKSPRM